MLLMGQMTEAKTKLPISISLMIVPQAFTRSLVIRTALKANRQPHFGPVNLPHAVMQRVRFG